jgi:hypothetical protein
MIEIYAKKQRAKRKDPQQEAIVAEKDIINERTKKLIALMISMKKGWNGGPSPNIGVDKFNLTQPMPEVIVGSGDAALHELADIVQILRQIKSMQDSYAVSHNQRSEALKKVKELPQIPTQQQPVVSSANTDIISKIASNPLTRIWAHLIAYNPFTNEKNRGYRLELLRSLARIESALEDIEDNILSQGETSILDSVYIAKQLYSDAKYSFFGDFRNNINKMITDTQKELEELKEKQKNTQRPIDRTLSEGNRLNVVIDTAITQAQNTLSEPPPTESPEPKEEMTEPANNTNVILNTETNISPEVSEKEPEVAIPSSSEVVVEPQEEPSSPVQTLTPEKPKKSKVKRKRKKIPVVPVQTTPQSDFTDSDFEKNQLEKFNKILEYVFKNIEMLWHECLNIANSNIPRFWKLKIREEARKAKEYSLEVIKAMENRTDFEIDYAHFLERVGTIKALAYMIEVEKKAEETDPNFVSGSLFNESHIQTQAINFAREQMGIFMAMTQKVSQASDASRFIKRMITYILPRRDKSLRLTISRNIRRAKDELQKLLNILEQRHVDFRKLMDVSHGFLEAMSHVFEGLAEIGDMYNSTMRMEKSVRKQRNIKMTYDMIPIADINALRAFGKSMLTDLFNIQKLEQLETDLTGA